MSDEKKSELGVAYRVAGGAGRNDHQSRISLERNAWWWRFDEGTGRAREYSCEEFLLKLGEVSFKAGEESREIGTELRAVGLTLHSNGQYTISSRYSLQTGPDQKFGRSESSRALVITCTGVLR